MTSKFKTNPKIKTTLNRKTSKIVKAPTKTKQFSTGVRFNMKTTLLSDEVFILTWSSVSEHHHHFHKVYQALVQALLQLGPTANNNLQQSPTTQNGY